MSFIGYYCGQRKPTKEEIEEFRRDVKDYDSTDEEIEDRMCAAGYLDVCYD